MSDKIVLFVAASGILIAVLLVWAQLWTTMAKEYEKGKNPTITAGYGLSFCYYAICASLLAFAITIITYSVNPWALILLSFSIILALFLVILSIWPVVTKTLRALPLLAPLPIGCFANKAARVLILFICPLVLLIFCWLVVYVVPFTKVIFDRLAG